MKLRKKLIRDGYEVIKKGKLVVSCDRANRKLAIDEAMSAAVGMDIMEDVLIYRVSVTQWRNDDDIIIREQQSRELALKVCGRKVKGTGGYIDYEEA